MPSPPGSAAKICAICGEDCSNKPRTKDRKGQYYCRTCYQQAMHKQRAGQPVHAAPKPASGPAPPPPPADRLDADDSSDPFAAMAALAPTEPLVAQETAPCPGCGANLAFNALVCSRCGYDKRTGEKGFQTPGGAPAARPARARKPSFGGAAGGIKAPWIAFAVPAAVFAILCLLGRGSLGCALLFIVLLVLTAFTVNVLVLYHAFRESVLTGILCLFIGPYNLYFALAKMDAPRTKNALYAVLLGILLIFLLPRASQDNLSAGNYGDEYVDEYADEEPDEYDNEQAEPADADNKDVSWAVPERFTDALALCRSHRRPPTTIRSGHPFAIDDLVRVQARGC